ncbi:MAG: TIGR04086 family membrane protein [Clostridia bacterium]|nr:TIGR04086 family membrane protein [Clostridia bacterium]
MRNESSFDGAFCVVKGAALALALSLLSAVVLAVILRCTQMSAKLVYPITQTVKAVCLCLGAAVFVRGEKGWLKGMAVGLVFTALSYLAFSSLGGDFSLSWLILLEVAISLAVGALGGIVGVNLK